MTPELDEKLVKDFPILYKDRYSDMRHTAMCWGFECSNGWEPLIRELSEKLENYNRRHLGEAIVATQVKEKFAGLRFYYYVECKTSPWRELCYKVRNFLFSKKLGREYWFIRHLRERLYKTELEKMEKLIDKAEADSESICEWCGAPGKLRGRMWVVTLCDNCYEKWMNKI